MTEQGNPVRPSPSGWGTSSLNNAEPLWVVDGIPTGGIDFLNPADIESISVLKDAAPPPSMVHVVETGSSS